MLLQCRSTCNLADVLEPSVASLRHTPPPPPPPPPSPPSFLRAVTLLVEAAVFLLLFNRRKKLFGNPKDPFVSTTQVSVGVPFVTNHES